MHGSTMAHLVLANRSKPIFAHAGLRHPRRFSPGLITFFGIAKTCSASKLQKIRFMWASLKLPWLPAIEGN
jgi:hypothetical protein